MLTDNILDLIGRTPLVRLKNEPVFVEPACGNIATVLPDRAERYFSTALM